MNTSAIISLINHKKAQALCSPFQACATRGPEVVRAPCWHTKLPSGESADQLREVLDLLPPLSVRHGPWCAGGAVRRVVEGVDISGGDLDLFFTGREEWAKFSKVLQDYEILHASGAATTFMVRGLKVQIIKRKFYDTINELMGDFDFTVCQMATDGTSMAHTQRALDDLESRVLRISDHGRISKITVVGRMLKYIGYGFTPEPGLFRMITESGLDLVSASQIFSPERPTANYDHDDKVEEVLDAKVFDSDALRRAALRLGVVL